MKLINAAPGIGLAVLALFALGSCGSGSSSSSPSFSLAWSEYPSWSTFGVADELGLINGKAGERGEIEERWDVDIVLKELDYDPCLTSYGSGAVDAVCITNMDVLNPSLGRPSVAILPTSTSNGADACIVVGIDEPADLAGRKVYGLEKSVSEYCFARNLEIMAVDASTTSFSNMDPGAAALAMQQQNEGYEAIMVWNPFVLDTLEKRAGSKVLFDSSSIPGEIVDMVVLSEESLNRPGGDRFACAVIDAFYAVAKRIEDPATRNDTLVALGEKFSSLGLESMKTVVVQTDFYESPALGIELFRGEVFPAVMQRVVKFCVSQDIVPKAPGMGWGGAGDAPGVALRFDPTFMEKVAAR
jgi:NitT/TauT family transport system substrate-binding protein